MNTTLICHLQTPQDDRVSASGILTLEYVTDEPAAVIRSDARAIADRGQKAIDEMIEEGCLRLASRKDEGCCVPEGFPVTVTIDGAITVVRPSY